MKMRCAIITDENSQILELLRKLISPWFERVYTTGLDHKVIKIADVDPPDLIVTNINRYFGNGLNDVRLWREIPSTRNAAVWVVSGSIDHNLEKICKSEVDMFFKKPFNSEEIIKSLERLAEARAVGDGENN